MSFTTCTVQTQFPAAPPTCGMSLNNGDGSGTITLQELTPKGKSLESTITIVGAERFREASESDRHNDKPCIWTARMLANAACNPFIRFINPIPYDPTLVQVFHVERLREGHGRQETIYYHQVGSLKYLLPVKKPRKLPLSASTINHLPERIARILTCCLKDEQLNGVALTFEYGPYQTTILWSKA